MRDLKRGEPGPLTMAWAKSRREAFINATNPTSIVNLRKLQSLSEEDKKNRVEEDPGFAKTLRAKMNDTLPESRGTRAGEDAEISTLEEAVEAHRLAWKVTAHLEGMAMASGLCYYRLEKGDHQILFFQVSGETWCWTVRNAR